MRPHPALFRKAPLVGAFRVGRRQISSLTFWVWLLALLTLIPILVLFSSLLQPADDVWQHMLEFVLADLLWNTLWLVVGVTVGTLLIGVGLAWLTSVCDFPGVRFFSWALLLPLAVPAYVTAFVMIGMLDFTGPLQTQLRGAFGPLPWFPRIRSRGGVILVMTLAFYPYVYLLARNAFMTQGKRALEAAQLFGLGSWASFFRVALPMARPWIIAGLTLVLMETLADFGAVSIFNYDTFTTAIYKAWFGLFSLPAASQLASILVVMVFLLLLVEQQSRLRVRYSQSGRGDQSLTKVRLRGWQAAAAFVFAGSVLLAAFLAPLAQLVLWAAIEIEREVDASYWKYLLHSVTLAVLAALITVAAALPLAYAHRRSPGFLARAAIRIATLGYAVPGTVLAVGIFIPMAWLDGKLIAASKALSFNNGGAILQGTLAAMLLAYLVRFLAVGFGSVDSAMQRITRNIDDAAQALGRSTAAMVAKVHLPMLRGGLFTAATLVFVDVMKEMPITLMTRPFGWDTLAVRIFELTSEGEWERAALPAVALVVAGLVPIILLTRQARLPAVAAERRAAQHRMAVPDAA